MVKVLLRREFVCEVSEDAGAAVNDPLTSAVIPAWPRIPTQASKILSQANSLCSQIFINATKEFVSDARLLDDTWKMNSPRLTLYISKTTQTKCAF